MKINYMKTWCLNMEVKNIISLPIVVLWFIWKARNQSYFEDSTLIPSQVSLFSLGLLRYFPQDYLVVNIRTVAVENIDKTYPWGYFDGSAAGVPQICGVGGILYLSDEHFFTFSAGLGLGTNNFAELLALKLLIILALKQGVHTLQIFGDSQLVINLVSGKDQ